ncbi:MAG TPA: TIGR03668 family PPOX class F420-dependent oxidoreductase [Streptosporangiaceae bacterium]|nr:TIGR03668 family PPOX class F420-dependent oxidoreductase [Streptosporangiaceae bacterium]
MRLGAAQAQQRFIASPVLRLATAGASGQPHVVPCTFVADDAGRIAIGIDNKPKTTTDLRRLRNITENPRVSMLVDHYSDDWDQLWWVRADGTAAIERSGPGHEAHWDQLRRKYPQYRGQTLQGPVVVTTVEKWAGWAYGER